MRVSDKTPTFVKEAKERIRIANDNLKFLKREMDKDEECIFRNAQIVHRFEAKERKKKDLSEVRKQNIAAAAAELLKRREAGSQGTKKESLETAQFPAQGYLRIWQILGDRRRGVSPLIPISRSSWFKGINEGRFPKGLLLGPATRVWTVESIRELLRGMNTK